MKYGLLILLLSTLKHLSTAQETTPSLVSNDLVGRWDVIYQDESVNGLLDEFVSATEEAEVQAGGNHNIGIFTFEQESTFRFISIQDYSASDEEGTFDLMDNGSEIVMLSKKPNAFKAKDRKKLKNRTREVLYFNEDVLVLKSKKDILYLKRTP